MLYIERQFLVFFLLSNSSKLTFEGQLFTRHPSKKHPRYKNSLSIFLLSRWAKSVEIFLSIINSSTGTFASPEN